MEFVPYDQFKNIEFIAEGGFSKIYKATWIDGPVYNYSHKNNIRENNYTVVLKKLNNSNNITSKGLNELKIFYELSSKHKYVNYVAKYFGITQDPNSQDIMIVMPYYESVCDGLRPPIVTNVPEGYIELMEECWHSDPDKRPQITDIKERLIEIYNKECERSNPTEIISSSSDIGPVTKNNPGAIYKSRPLSAMINSAMSLRSSRSQSINLEKVKRKFEDGLIEDNIDNGRSVKRNKLYKVEDYHTKEIELDIDTNYNNNEYITTEIDFDI
ncbi:unnamed protein product [Rhizophagus irregularis]|nr:unnamed protein product [Rhizophagus irregularis]